MYSKLQLIFLPDMHSECTHKYMHLTKFHANNKGYKKKNQEGKVAPL